VLIWTIALALGGDPSDVDRQAIEAEVVDDFVVLDVTPTHAAVRIVHRPADPHGLLVCLYPDMRGHRRSGLDLWLVELASGRAKRFAVYAPAKERKQCTPRATSRQALEAAEAAFEAHGLDVDRLPSPVLPTEGTFSLDAEVEVRTSREEQGPTVRFTAELVHGERVLHQTSVTSPRAAASWGRVTYTRAYPTDEGPVFVLSRFRYEDRSPLRTVLRLLPPLDLEADPASPPVAP